MIITPKSTKIKLELMSNEIEAIRDELERVSHTIYEFMNYTQIVDKLNKALENKKW